MNLARISAFFLAFLVLLSCSQPLHGGTVTFDVSFRTSSSFLPESSYILDFQFTQGDPSEIGSNSASIFNSDSLSDFVLVDGPVPGSGEKQITFIPGQPVTFSIEITDLVTSTVTPDLLSLSIFDRSYNYVTTTDPTNNDALIYFTESTNPANPNVTALTYDTPNNDFQTSVTSLTSVPEPSNYLLLLIPLLIGHRLKPSPRIKSA